MTPDESRAVYDRFAVKVIWYPPTADCPRWRKSFQWSERNRRGTTAAEVAEKRALVYAAVAVLNREPPVETPAPDASLSFLAA